MKTSEKKRDISQYRKEQPTIFPFGVRVRRVGGGAIVVDFIDESAHPMILASVAMLKDQAISLAEGILGAFNDEIDQE